MLKRYFKSLTLFILGVLLLTSGFGCKTNIIKGDDFKTITLNYWGVWDSPDQINTLISQYEASHPTIKIKYKNFRYEEYETKLSEALWEDRLPDVFAIPSSWLKEYQDRLVPMPKTVKIPVAETKGTIKKEVITSLKTINSLTTADVKRQYVQVVADNVIIDDKIYGLPYSLDTLVTFYNIDLLTKAGIAEPIADWHDLADQAPKLSKIGSANQIYQSAVSLGGADNIPRFFDVISNVMMQNGVNLKGKKFSPDTEGESINNFVEALNFYSDFANPTKAVFSWDNDLPNAFELFTQGKLAYFFGYSYHLDELNKRGVSFNWDITNFPQARGAQGTKYFANYWVNVVPAKSKNKDAGSENLPVQT